MPVSPSKWRTGPSISHKSCGSTTCESESTQCTIMRHHHEQALRSNDTTATPHQQCRFLKLSFKHRVFGLLVFFGAYGGVPSSEEYPSYPSELAEPDAARSPTWPLRTVGRDALTSGETPVTRPLWLKVLPGVRPVVGSPLSAHVVHSPYHQSRTFDRDLITQKNVPKASHQLLLGYSNDPQKYKYTRNDGKMTAWQSQVFQFVSLAPRNVYNSA